MAIHQQQQIAKEREERVLRPTEDGAFVQVVEDMLDRNEVYVDRGHEPFDLPIP